MMSDEQVNSESSQAAKPSRSGRSLLDVGVVVAIIGLGGTGLGHYLQANANLKLEAEKFRSTLILKALASPSPEEALKSLRFMVSVGLLQDPHQQIAQAKLEDVPYGIGGDALHMGSSGPNVLRAQEALHKLGYLPEQPDGVFGYSTALAVKAFQAKSGQAADGILGPRSSADLFTTAQGVVGGKAGRQE